MHGALAKPDAASDARSRVRGAVVAGIGASGAFRRAAGFVLAAVLCCVLQTARADDESALSKAMGERFAADVDRALEENGIKSVVVFGFVSRDASDRISEGTNGLLPNELAQDLRRRLTNLRKGGKSKYKVMPYGALAGRVSEAKATAAKLEDKATVQTLLGSEYEVMVYGFVSKDMRNEGRVKVEFVILKIVNDEIDTLKVDYNSYKVGDDPATLTYLGENFPPLFVVKPSGETLTNSGGMLGTGDTGNIVVYIRVDGKRLPFFRTAGEAQNQLKVKIPFGSEYEIELFDPGADRRKPAGKARAGDLPRLAVAVMVDGLNSIGDWAGSDGGPSRGDFYKVDDPFNVPKWVVGGDGVETRDEKGRQGKSVFVKGWQLSRNQGRRFLFAKTKDSLAASTNQITPNLGVITVVAYTEHLAGKGEGGATGLGSEFNNPTEKISMQLDATPKQVVNICYVPVDGQGGGEAAENLQLITQ